MAALDCFGAVPLAMTVGVAKPIAFPARLRNTLPKRGEKLWAIWNSDG